MLALAGTAVLQDHGDSTAKEEFGYAVDSGIDGSDDKQVETNQDQLQSDAIVRLYPQIDSHPRDIKVLQQWVGRVDKVMHDGFIARLLDNDRENVSPEEVELDLEEVSPSDSHLVKEGAVFYWTIGYENYSHGPRAKFSRVKFRRLFRPDVQEPPQWLSELFVDAD